MCYNSGYSVKEKKRPVTKRLDHRSLRRARVTVRHMSPFDSEGLIPSLRKTRFVCCYAPRRQDKCCVVPSALSQQVKLLTCFSPSWRNKPRRKSTWGRSVASLPRRRFGSQMFGSCVFFTCKPSWSATLTDLKFYSTMTGRRPPSAMVTSARLEYVRKLGVFSSVETHNTVSPKHVRLPLKVYGMDVTR